MSSSPLEDAIASSSSKKTIQGEHIFAFQNISRIAFSVSPTYFENNSGPLIDMKLSLLSVAKAFAHNVLEHPGGPYNRIPAGGLTPNLLNDSGCFKGHSTHC